MEAPEGSPLQKVHMKYEFEASNVDGFNRALEAAKNMPDEE